MSVSDSYGAFVVEQLSRVTPVTAKKMFGGLGIYADGLFFALVAEDTLYFKVDDSNRADFEQAGMGPFKPFGDDSQVMQYYEVPGDVLEDADELERWMGKAIAVAQRKKHKSPKR